MEDLYTYMKSLQFMLDLKPSTIFPGHGPVISDPIPFIENYIQHRQQREAQILNCLKENKGNKLTIEEIREKVYKVRNDSLSTMETGPEILGKEVNWLY